MAVFSLENKWLKLDSAADAEPHFAPLRALADVAEVRLQGNTLGVGACKLLGEILAEKKSLQTANLADIFTGRLLNEIPEALSALLTSIVNLPRLTTINLNDNAFGLNTQAPLVAFLAAHIPLQHLSLNNNGLGPHAGILIADALSDLHAKKTKARAELEAASSAPAFPTVPALETVVCGRNRLENGSMQAWARAFSLHSKVRTIRMVQNGIRPEGISHLLSAGLAKCRDLQTLDLQDNTFTTLGARALAGAVIDWPQLRELGVGDCLLGAKGCAKLAAALAQAKNLQLSVLRLQYNEITAKALSVLANTVATDDRLPALRRVEVNGNKLSESDDCLEKLTKVLDARKAKASSGAGAAQSSAFASARGSADDAWGLDNLSDLEDNSDSDGDEWSESDAEPEPDAEAVAAKLVKEADEAQAEPTVQMPDKSVDALAKQLEKINV